MDGVSHLMSPNDLYSSIGNAASPVIADLRQPDAFERDDALVAGAIRRHPEEVEIRRDKP